MGWGGRGLRALGGSWLGSSERLVASRWQLISWHAVVSVSDAEASDGHHSVQGRQVQALADCAGKEGPPLPEHLTVISTPMDWGIWAQELAGHPDAVLVREILRGIREGFRIGYSRDRAPLKARGQNMQSAAEHRDIVDKYLAGEMESGRVALAGTPKQAEALGIHCSPFGVIPKKNRPGKFRLILNLSAPEGSSVNDGIGKELASLSYVTLDEVAESAARLGRGSLLAKMDIRQAYRQVSVHPDDRPLLGMLWKGKVYVDTTLPFGLRSAPLLFTALADAAEWVMKRRGTTHVFHYVDDFITMGADLAECTQNDKIIHETCARLGLPPEPEKDEGPATCITFLGIDIDTVAMELRLPADNKLARLTSELAGWRGRKACKKRDLLSLIGVLSHACKVVRAGRTFLRRLIELSTTTKKLEHFVRLSREARSDIEWWWQFSAGWNGIKLLRNPAEARPSTTLVSDASGSWGCGAHWGSQWFQLPWAGQAERWHITAKELVPIVVAAVLWGRDWKGRMVLARCDNSAVVSIIGKGSSRDREAMHLARCLAFFQAEFDVVLVASHIKGAENVLADALSRNNVAKFRAHCPQAATEPTAIPEALRDLLLIKMPDWTCPSWTELWSAIVRAV